MAAYLRGTRSETRAKFARFNFEVDHNPLHLGISKSCSTQFFGDRLSSFTVVSLRLERDKPNKGDTKQPALFVCLRILEDDLVRRSVTLNQVAELPDVIPLYATDIFHEHYKIPFEEDVFICPVKAFPLTKVVYGAKTKRCYDWAKNRVFSTGLLVSVCQQRVLARLHDSFLAPIIPVLNQDEAYSLQFYQDILTLECEPIVQGVISVNTSVIITDISSSDIDVVPQAPLSRQQNIGEELSFSSLAPNSLPSTSQVTSDEGQNLKFIALKPVLVPKLSTLQKASGLKESICEIGCQIFVSRVALKQLGVPNGSWVVASLSEFLSFDTEPRASSTDGTVREDGSQVDATQGKDGSKISNSLVKRFSSRSHICQVFVHEDTNDKDKLVNSGFHAPFLLTKADLSLRPDEVALSPVMWFNLQTHPAPLIQPDALMFVRAAKEEELHAIQTVSCETQTPADSFKPPSATAVHLDLIKSPTYPMTSYFDEAIKKYFKVTRLVSEGDVICLTTSDFPEYMQNISDGYEFHSPIVYYKITKILPVVPKAISYLANSLHTNVFQSGASSSFIPATADVFLSSRLHPVWRSPLPPGLVKYISEVEDIICPFIQRSPVCDRLAASLLLIGPTGCGKSTVVRAVCRLLNIHCYSVNCYSLLADTSAATEAKIKVAFFKAGISAPCIFLMRNVHALAKDRDGEEEDPRVIDSLRETITTHATSKGHKEWPLVVIATTANVRTVPADLQACFLHHVEMSAPTEFERSQLLQALCEDIPTAFDVNFDHIAKRTAGMVLGDVTALVSHALRAALKRIVTACSVGSDLSITEEHDLCDAGIQIHQSDFDVALDQLQASHADTIGAPKIPNVKWEDVGGLTDVKAEILDTIQLPLQHPELFAAGLRRSGVLLFGPPGTGKTLLAKAVATECSLNFLSVKGPELINMYVGQSEENVREVFTRARSAAPCVIFFDELDSLAPNRGKSGDSGGVMDRVVSQLLAELDGLHKAADVFVIGATNRPDLLDSALLRPGRFDKLLYLGVSEDPASQVKILQALTRKFSLSPDLSLDHIAHQCPRTLTGADLYALCSDAMLCAIKRRIAQLESGETTSQTDVVVEERDFLIALDRLVPSVSDQELQHYQIIQNQISQGI